MKYKFQLLLIMVLFLSACRVNYNNRYHFIEIPKPIAPDYSNHSNWAALPFVRDYADVVPNENLKNKQDESLIDVFYVHPTTFGSKNSPEWNASVDDDKTNFITDFWAIRHQSTAFNNVGKIYAPRYRQAHVKSYYHLDSGGKEALLFAYEDVKRAFEYYLINYNKGRPFIIASHSQGSTHAHFLIRDFIDGKALSNKLVAAYLLGMSISKNVFKTIPPCEDANQTQCFVSWQTFSEGYLPKDDFDEYRKNAFVINPISWSVDECYSTLEDHKGLLMSDYKTVYKASLKARVNKKKNIIWITKPKVPFSFLLKRKDYHVGDYNLFWFNIRENAKLRTNSYFEYYDSN